ncbi:hypothetical protein [Dapis sp. BLCC M229]|uniref:hypothetical protein n=1 Tax=Dapis sp. BLCC M229 TaxID=3400188 RepID=UPI003CF6A2EA
MKKYRQFNLTFLGLVFPGLLSFGLFNLAVDPYGVMNNQNLFGLELLKIKKIISVRLFKAVDVTRIQPKTLLLGSSRSDLGLDPKHPAFKNKQPAYNLALVGPNIYEVKRYFEHALKNQPELKTVVIGIDFFMFNKYKVNEADFNEKRLEKTSLIPQDFVNVSFSLDALDASQETIKASVKSDAYYLYHPDGLRYVYQNKPNEPIPKKFKGMLSGLMRGEGYYKKYQLSTEFLNDLKDIVETCQKKNIDLKIFISPSHASQWESIQTVGLWSAFEDWKREIVKITPVWDFSGYNTITTEPITKNMKNYWDSSHYRKEVGDLVMNRLFDYQNEIVPKDFGVLITESNIESHLQKIRDRQEIWGNNNPDIVQLVEKLKPEEIEE